MVYYLNCARPTVPKYIQNLKPDLVVYHYTLLLQRQCPDEWARVLGMMDFLRAPGPTCVLLAQDEQVRMDLLNAFIRDHQVTHIFSPSPEHAWRRVYPDAQANGVTIHPILTGYIDERTADRLALGGAFCRERPLDIGYRSWYMPAFYGRHGQMKQIIGRLFQERAADVDLLTDISLDADDALLGDSWFQFLLNCKYTIGVEGGCSVFDWDGEIARCVQTVASANPDASFEEIEAACFPHQDGEFDYRLISPRHLEAVMAGTCQVLVEGDYAGVLKPGDHFIELKRDFSNLDQVLRLVKEDRLRDQIVERAYKDVVGSGRYTYRVLAEQVLSESRAPSRRAASPYDFLRLLNRIDESTWSPLADAAHNTRVAVRALLVRLLGEQRTARLLAKRHIPKG